MVPLDVCANTEDPATNAKTIAAIPNNTDIKPKNFFIEFSLEESTPSANRQSNCEFTTIYSFAYAMVHAISPPK
jgi:hypothetical protein